ncbi:MAG: hypothetical protein ACLPWG_10340, partial [Steroidobacteraceae bacterium]
MMLEGCVPFTTTYPKIEAPAATYFAPGCTSDFQPRSTVYFPFHGIYISIDLEASRFGLHIPRDNVVQLDGTTIEIEGTIGTTPYKSAFPIRAVKRDSIGTTVGPD